jgi:hypothetical protein
MRFAGCYHYRIELLSAFTVEIQVGACVNLPEARRFPRHLLQHATCFGPTYHSPRLREPIWFERRRGHIMNKQ